MSARQDTSTPSKFYFGNAFADLNHLIPKSDEQDFVAFRPAALGSSDLETEKQLSAIHAHLNELADVQAKLSFAIRDIKRSLR